MSEINRAETKRAIKDYDKYEWWIKQRELELMHPYSFDRDENVGGGKMQFGKNEGVANKAIKIATDEMIEELKLTKEAIDIALNQSDRETRIIVHENMTKRYPKSVRRLSVELAMSVPMVYKKMNIFIGMVYELTKKIKKHK